MSRELRPLHKLILALSLNKVCIAHVSCLNVPHTGTDAGGKTQVSKRAFGWTLFGACAAAIVFVIVGGHVGTVVGDPLRLWSRWASGEKVDDARLWGWPMLAWGRMGKLLQFAAGLTVILDLAEPDRLRDFGTWLRRKTWRRFADQLEQPVMTGGGWFLLVYIALLFAVVVVKPPRAVSDAVVSLLLGPVGLTGVVLCALSLGFLFLKALKEDRQKAEGSQFLLAYLPFLLVGGLPMLLWIATTRGLLIPLADGLARALDRNRPGRPLRWAALVLFVTGAGLDLLAS